jgi:glycogen operon protein
VEGETDDPKIRAFRLRLAKNFIAILMLSQGVPMLLAGDEALRSQRGNNNCYCQDNSLSWFDWNLPEKNQEMVCFTRKMIQLRKRHPALRRSRFLSGKVIPVSGMPDICWHGKKLHKPEWDNPDARILACTISRVEQEEEDLHLIFNMSTERMRLYLPKLETRCWHLCVNTAGNAPLDIIEQEVQQPIRKKSVLVNPRCVMVLESR